MSYVDSISKRWDTTDIEWIVNTLNRFGVKCVPSTNKKLRFYRIAKVCFSVAGVKVEPETAIKAYKSIHKNQVNRKIVGAEHPQIGQVNSDCK